MRPCINRRPLFRDYEKLMAEFEVESHEDFHIYLRMESAMFHDRTSGA